MLASDCRLSLGIDRLLFDVLMNLENMLNIGDDATLLANACKVPLIIVEGV